MSEVRYPYYSPGKTLLLEGLDLAKWCGRNVLRKNPEPQRLPNLLKRRVLASYARWYGLRTFVESGTYLGDTVAYMRKCCRQVYSVELQPHLARSAQLRFAQDAGVRIFHGDSSAWISQIITWLGEPALFWLDGHFAAGTARESEIACPTLQEIKTVLSDCRYRHVILIDDAREFTGSGGYPHIDDVYGLVRSLKPDADVELKDDIIRVVPSANPIRSQDPQA